MVRRVIAGALVHWTCWLSACALWACGSEVDDRPATFSYIHAAILVPNCTTSGCHSSLSAVGGIVLEERDHAYVYLLGPDEATGAGNLVVPFQPRTSKLMYLLRGSETWNMPPEQPLPEADIELIERWILEGAQR